jgi:signal transduction histidine kinase/CheY-like chemotaxis protein
MFDLISHAVFVLLFILSVADLVRYRDLPRLEVVALFGTLAVVMIVDAAGRVLGKPDPTIALVMAMVLVAQPYLLLRLVHHFRPIPRPQHAVALTGLVVSWVALIAGGQPLAPWATALVVGEFLYVEAYAALVLLRASRVAAGVGRLRMIAAALGSAFLAGAILAAGVTVLLPGAPFLTDAASALAVASALGYYAGFAPPRWLRQFWQMTEFRRFVVGMGQTPAEQRLDAALEFLGPAAQRGVGASSVILAMGKPGDATLVLNTDAATRTNLRTAGISTIGAGPENPLLYTAWSECKPVLGSNPTAWGAGLGELARAAGGAESCLIAPLVTTSGTCGVAIAFFARWPLFLEDDLELLTLIAQQCALAIEEGQIYTDTQRRAAEREVLLYLIQSVAREVDPNAIGTRLVTQMERLVPCFACSLLLPRPDGSFVVSATAGAGGDSRRGQILPAGTSLASRAVAARAPVAVADLSRETEIKTINPETRSMLAVPIIEGESVRGVLNFQSQDIAAYGPAQIATAQIVAAHAEVALSRAHLFDEIQHRNAELERASRTKSEFLANMSHELRTPLNAIIGFSELLIDEPDDGYDKETRSTYVETIHQSGQHLLALINDILDLSKVEAGRMELHPEPVSIPETIAHVLRTVDPLLARKHIILEAEAIQAGDLTADEGKLKQVLYNLLSNAIKFTDEGGRVTVEAHRYEDFVRLTVADTGVGIAPEDQERIFDEFQQVDGGPARRFEGTGLGLALTRRLAELHGGRIWLESEPGHGSRFHVELPIQDAPIHEVHPELARERALPLSRPSRNGDGDDTPLVLVVEDDARSANLLAVYLHGGGFRSAVATDGREAIEMAQQLQPAAITLDVMLPDLEGWEVLRMLKLNELTRDIPVAIISVVDDSHLGYALGATDYFVKPVDRQALLTWLERHSRRTDLVRPPVRVLVVDDESSARDLIAGMLTPAGYDVVTAAGGREGIARARDSDPDLILLDLMMPEVSGFDVVAALKSDSATSHIPILILTAKDVTEEDKRMLNGDVAAILRKGALPAVELITWLNHALPHTNPSQEVVDVAV